MSEHYQSEQQRYVCCDYLAVVDARPAYALRHIADPCPLAGVGEGAGIEASQIVVRGDVLQMQLFYRTS